jgi:acyl carrier protein
MQLAIRLQLTRPELFAEVTEVVRAALELDEGAPRIEPETSLLALGLDSLNAAELAVSLEAALGLDEFPMQAWADAEALRDEPQFTVGSLVAACEALMEAGAEDDGHD